MDTTEDLLKRSAQPMQLTHDINAALDDLGTRIGSLGSASDDPTLTRVGREALRALRRSRRRRQRILTGAAGLAVLAAAAPAAANYIGLHTGHYGHDGSHHGEFLNLNSPEGIQLLRHFEGQYPLPPGGSWNVTEQRFLNGPAGEGQAGVFEEAAGLEAQCQWTQAWLEADAAGDGTAAKSAAAVLAKIPTWHVITAYQDETRGSERLAHAVADAAARGDREPAQAFVTANCSSKAPGQ
jgi:hypothetical protein